MTYFSKTGDTFFTAVVPTKNLRDLLLRTYTRRGWKYFVVFKDVNGYGLQAAYRAEWQDDNSAVSIQ